MTHEKQKKIGTIAAMIFLAVIAFNSVTLRSGHVNVVALLVLVVVALVTAALYIRDNAPLPRKELMRQYALIALVLLLVVFSVPAML